MSVRIQLRRDTAANWASTNPTLTQGEPGYETDTGKIKYGDGSTAWNSLGYAEGTQEFDLGSASAPSITFTGDTNTGIYSPGADQLAISSNSSERIRIGANGEIGIGGANYGTSGQVLTSGGSGAAPSWTTLTVNTDKIEEGNSSAEVIDTGSDGRFVVTTEGSERLRVDSSGRLGLGVTSPLGNLHIEAPATSAGWQLRLDSVGLANESGFYRTASDNYEMVLRNAAGGLSYLTNTGGASTSTLEFVVQGSERARIDSSGRLLVGTSSARANFFNSTISPGLQLEGAGSLVASQRFASITNNFATDGDGGGYFVLARSKGGTVGSTTVVASGDQLGAIGFQGSDGTQFVLGARIEALVDGTPGADDMPGRLVFSTTADGASSPTERMRITENGSVFVGKTANGLSNLGIQLQSLGQGGFTTNSDYCLFVNRQGNDGELVRFYQGNTLEGNISVTGATVALNGAHLSRWSQLVGIDPYDKTARPEILRGTVMSNLDEMCDWTCPTSGECQDNEQLNKTEISSVDDDPNVAGVFQSWDDDDDTWVNDFYLAMTGDFVIRIAAGTTVQRGDLLCSAGDGTARPQGDRYLKDSTIAKVTSTTVSCTHPDGSYCVPCVLMAC